VGAFFSLSLCLAVVLDASIAQRSNYLESAHETDRRTARMHGVPIYAWEKGGGDALCRECAELRLGVP